jgi:hypothetical protein
VSYIRDENLYGALVNSLPGLASAQRRITPVYLPDIPENYTILEALEPAKRNVVAVCTDSTLSSEHAHAIDKAAVASTYPDVPQPSCDGFDTASTQAAPAPDSSAGTRTAAVNSESKSNICLSACASATKVPAIMLAANAATVNGPGYAECYGRPSHPLNPLLFHPPMFSTVLPGRSEKYFASNITPDHLKPFARRGHDRYLVLRQNSSRGQALSQVGVSASWDGIRSHDKALSYLHDDCIDKVRASFAVLRCGNREP